MSASISKFRELVRRRPSAEDTKLDRVQIEDLDRRAWRGLESEFLVEKHLRQKGWRLVARRWKTPWAEVDAVYTRKDQILLVEVKSRGSLAHLDRAISRRQKQRLLRVLENLVEVYSHQEVLFHLALVLPQGRIHWCCDFLSE